MLLKMKALFLKIEGENLLTLLVLKKIVMEQKQISVNGSCQPGGRTVSWSILNVSTWVLTFLNRKVSGGDVKSP